MNANIFAKANQIINACDAAYFAVLDENGSPHVSAVSNIGAEGLFGAYKPPKKRSQALGGKL